MERWRSIVEEVLFDVSDVEACFQSLYDHFALPSSWHCDPAAINLLAALDTLGCRVGIASNFDRRLRSVCSGMPALAPLFDIVISSELGWRKPSGAFFDAVCQAMQTPPSQLLYVGDDPLNDFEAAKLAGCHALLFDPGRHMADRTYAIQNLSEVIERALELTLGPVQL